MTVVPRALAQTTLTQIQDTVYNTDGSLFNGTLLVTWTGTAGLNSGLPTPSNASVTIYNGILSVTLVPSTTSPGAAPYTAVFTSSDGLVTWTETWQVPPASSPLTLSEVNTTSSTSSGTQLSINQVIGLTSNLNALNGSLISLTAQTNSLYSTVNTLSTEVSSLTTQVTSLAAGNVGSASATINTAFADAEVPAGIVNGTNTTFTLANTPSAASALAVYLNGLLLTNGKDFTLSGSTVTFLGTAVPQTGDTVQAFYRMAGTSSAPVFVDNSIPAGTINGSNLTFTLSSPPAPLLSLRLYKNGDLMQQNVDYTLSGKTIAFANTTVTPQTGDSLVAFYRVTP